MTCPPPLLFFARKCFFFLLDRFSLLLNSQLSLLSPFTLFDSDFSRVFVVEVRSPELVLSREKQSGCNKVALRSFSTRRTERRTKERRRRGRTRRAKSSTVCRRLRSLLADFDRRDRAHRSFSCFSLVSSFLRRAFERVFSSQITRRKSNKKKERKQRRQGENEAQPPSSLSLLAAAAASIEGASKRSSSTLACPCSSSRTTEGVGSRL